VFPIKVTIKNYRCFSDEAPLRLKLNRGFTSMIGLNNAGKSSALRLLYELRPSLRDLVNSPQLFFNSKKLGFGAPDVADIMSLFFVGNDRPMEIDIRIPSREILEQPFAPIDRVVMTCLRQDVHWRIQSFRDRECVAGEVTLKGENRFGVRDKGDFDVTELRSALEMLTKSLYIGSFRNAISASSGKHYDLALGSEFVKTWKIWQTGGNRANAKQIQHVVRDIEQLFGYQRLEIVAAEQRNTLAVTVDDLPYDLSDLGSGISQFIVVVGNAAVNRPTFILIDEPELNLHPALQRLFLTTLARYAREGVVFATHSMGLARSTATRIYSFQKPGSHSIVHRLEDTPDYAEFLGELSFSSYRELGCDCILLVEGVHDVTALQQFLRKFGKETKAILLPLGGSEMIRGDRERELGELQRFNMPIAAFIDREGDSASDIPEQRLRFKQLCERLSFRVHMTERRAIENYFSDRAVKAALGPSYNALAPDQLLASAKPGWDKSDNWKITEEMQLDEIRDTDVGRFLMSI
jgi:predicted ATPase